jgi:hypothetical protein
MTSFLRHLPLLVLFGLALAVPVAAKAGDTRPKPKVDVEVVWTDIYEGKTDIFSLITNPNDFDVYVGKCGSCKFQQNAKTVFGDGSCCGRQEDFTLLAAKSKRLFQLERGCTLEPGPNHFRVRSYSEICSKSKLPWDYVVTGTQEFEFVIPNGDSAKR